MRTTLLVNPFASSVSDRKVASVERALGTGLDLTVVTTSRRGHATSLAREAAGDGSEVVAVLGGDGTMNEVANGLAGTRTALAPLPGGSTNVFARTIGMANDLRRATRQLSTSLAAGSVRRVPLGVVNGRRFLFHAGIGFDAAVVAQVERRPKLKRRFGQVAFVVATVATLARHFDRHRSHFTMRFDPGTTIEGAYAIVMCSNPYTYVGRIPLDLTPDAVPGRGLVAVTVRRLTVPTLAVLMASAMASGRRLRASPRVDHRPDLRSFTVSGHGPCPYQADGDYLGTAETLELSYESHALAVVAPLPGD